MSRSPRIARRTVCSPTPASAATQSTPTFPLTRARAWSSEGISARLIANDNLPSFTHVAKFLAARSRPRRLYPPTHSRPSFCVARSRCGTRGSDASNGYPSPRFRNPCSAKVSASPLSGTPGVPAVLGGLQLGQNDRESRGLHHGPERGARVGVPRSRPLYEPVSYTHLTLPTSDLV